MKLDIEAITGKPCQWIITYRRNGRPKFDGAYESWGKTPEAVKRTFFKQAQELGWRVTDVEVRRREDNPAKATIALADNLLEPGFVIKKAR